MSAAGRLALHVGLPKTGTTFLQAVLAHNRRRLREAGVVYPFVRPEGMFHAAVEVCREYDRWGLDRALVDGTWQELARRARRFDGDAVISHEVLAGATSDQVAWAASSLDELDLHLVVTVRDPARLVPAHWQEAVKNGYPVTFAQLTDEVLQRPGAPDTTFWSSHDLPRVLDRWGGTLAPDHVHVVVVPPAGTAPEALWARFEEAAGIPAGVADLDVGRGANPSLGTREVHLLRQVVAALDGTIPQPAYARVVKRLFAQRLLSRVPSARVPAPETLRDPLEALAGSWRDHVLQRGYVVHGDLAELAPTEFGSVDPDEVAEPVAAATVDSFVSTLREIARLRQDGASAAPTQSPAWRRLLRRTSRLDVDAETKLEAGERELARLVELWSASQTSDAPGT